MTTLDLFGQDPTLATTIAPPAGSLAKQMRVEITAGPYAGLTGEIIATWQRQDGEPCVDVGLDAGYVVSVRVSGVGRL